MVARRFTPGKWIVSALGAAILVASLWALAFAISWPVDDGGKPAPPCVTLNASGVPVLCSDTNPVPTSAAIPMASATSTTGFMADVVDACPPANCTPGFAFHMVNNAYGVALQGNSGAKTIWTTINGGRRWITTATNTVTAGMGTPRWLYRTASNRWVYGKSGDLTNPIFTSTDLRTWTAAGSASFLADGGPSQAFGVQGTTLVASYETNANTDEFLCRSTDDGVNWTCTSIRAMVGLGANVRFRSQSIASPTSSIWVAIAESSTATDSPRVLRSIDDGQSWAVAATLAPGGNNGDVTAITCISGTVCLASTDTVLWRSTDAGVTWGQVYADAATSTQAFVSFGGGVVVAIGSVPGGGGGFRSFDSGATWTPLTSTGDPFFSCGGALGDSIKGRIHVNTTLATVALTCSANATNAVRTVFSGSIREVQQGPAYDINSGQSIVKQGNPAATSSRWPVFISDGVASPGERGIVGSPLRVDPTGTTTQPVNGTVTANQGTAAAQANRWPAFLSDGTNGVGTTTLPLHVRSPVQSGTLANSSVTGAADTAVVATVAAAAGERGHVYSVSAFCAAAGTATLTIVDGATTIYQLPAAGVGITEKRVEWPVGLTGAVNSAVVVTLTTCGAGNTGTLTVQADRF